MVVGLDKDKVLEVAEVEAEEVVVQSFIKKMPMEIKSARFF